MKTSLLFYVVHLASILPPQSHETPITRNNNIRSRGSLACGQYHAVASCIVVHLGNGSLYAFHRHGNCLNDGSVFGFHGGVRLNGGGVHITSHHVLDSMDGCKLQHVSHGCPAANEASTDSSLLHNESSRRNVQLFDRDANHAQRSLGAQPLDIRVPGQVRRHGAQDCRHHNTHTHT